MKPQVLLMENDESLRESLTWALRSERFEVVPCQDPQEALHRLQEQDIDLVLLNVDSPHRQGWAVARRIALSRILLPLGLITAKPGQQVRAARVGADVLFEKPLDLGKMVDTVKHLLGPRRSGLRFRLQEAYAAAASSLLSRCGLE